MHLLESHQSDILHYRSVLAATRAVGTLLRNVMCTIISLPPASERRTTQRRNTTLRTASVAPTHDERGSPWHPGLSVKGRRAQ
jgi:hypothetical protein